MKKTTDRPATVPTSLEPCTGSAPAFTLPELLVILAVLMVLGVMVLPALARSGLNSRAFQCLNNSRQLCTAWRMYSDDNQDRMVLASDDGRGIRNPLNAYAWTLTHLDFSQNPANWDPTVGIMTRPLWPYNKSVNIYRCPSDLSYVVYGGVSRPRVRSMSMNFFLGGFAGGSAALGVGTGTWGGLYPVYFKLSDLNSHASPGPADTFVFIDERSDAINWGCYLTDMSGYPNRLYPKAAPTLYEFNQDLPGFLHDLAASVSFADGRAEFHRWLDPRTTPPLQLGGVLTGGKGGGEILPAPYDPDVAWLQAHAARPK